MVVFFLGLRAFFFFLISSHLMVGVFFFYSILDLEHFSQVIYELYYRLCPSKLTQPSGAVHSIWWLGFFFFDLFSYSGLRAFFTSDFTNCTTDYAPQINPTIRCCSQHLMVGVFFFFDLFSYSGLRAFFTSDFTNCTTDYAPPQINPTIRCCSQHLMVVFFFFDLFSYSGLRAFFTSDFTNCTTDYAPPKLTSTILFQIIFHKLFYELYYRLPNHQVLFTASDGWVFFFDLFSYSGLRAFFTSDFTNCTTDYAPPKLTQPSGAVHSIWWLGFFFLTSSPILDLEHFSQVILRIVLQIMPPPKLTQPSGAVHSIWWLGFFFDLFSYSGLRAFFTSDFTNCTTDYAPPKLPQPSGAVHSIWWLGFFFFLTSSPILDLEHFSQVILRIVLQIMPLPQINPTIRCCSQHLMVGVFFFLTSSPILDLEHFSQVIWFYELYYRLCPPPNYPNHQVLFTASDGWGFFFLTSSPILDLEHFSQVILRIVLQIMPPPKLPQPSGAVHSIWWLGIFFFLTSSPILDLEHFSQVILRIVLQIMPPKLTQPSGAVHSTTDGWGFFFLTSSPILDLEHFSQVILRIVLQIMPPPKLPQPSGAVHSIWWLGFFFFFWSLLLFWT